MNEFMKNFSLEGKIAFVTGASYGIGFAIANALSAAGATIVFNDINQDLVNKGLAAYEEKGIKAHGYVCDVTDEEAVQKTVAQIREEVGVIDILVNNAGIIKRIPMIEMTAAQFRQVIDVDLNAPFIVAKAVIPDMIEQGGGKIINISSVAGLTGNAGQANYSSSKAGVVGLTKTVARELASRHINCNAIAPGAIRTPMTDAMDPKDLQAILDTLKFNEIFPRPSSAVQRVTFDEVPPTETNSGKFTVSGTGTSGQYVILCLMRLSGGEPINYETQIPKNGKFSFTIQLPQEGVWLMTYTITDAGKEVLQEDKFSLTTYKKTLLIVNLDADLPEAIVGDTLTISGTTMRQTQVQCIIDGRYQTTPASFPSRLTPALRERMTLC